MARGTLTGYSPQPEKESGIGVFNGEVVCKVNEAALKGYDVPQDNPAYNAEFEDTQNVSIELEVVGGEFEGRRLWKRFFVDDETPDKRGKTSIQKLSDYLISADTKLIGSSDAEIRKALDEFSLLTLNVKAYHFTGSSGKEVQQHIIKGLAPEGAQSEVPF